MKIIEPITIGAKAQKARTLFELRNVQREPNISKICCVTLEIVILF